MAILGRNVTVVLIEPLLKWVMTPSNIPYLATYGKAVKTLGFQERQGTRDQAPDLIPSHRSLAPQL